MRKIGIDAGGSLIKIVYQEDRKIHYKMYPVDEAKQVIQWLNLTAPDSTIRLTGGKSANLQFALGQDTTFVDEFTAMTNGVRILLSEENVPVNDFVLVSLGTGTSIFHVTERSFERVMGTGIGGGTLMGLGTLIGGNLSFHEVVERAKIGDRTRSDLLVRDIYENMDSPLLGDLTAANFGKAHRSKEATVNDHLAALIQLIGETIILLARSVAQVKGTKHIVFVGSTLMANDPLKQVFVQFKTMLDYEPIFLEKGAFAGAIGAFYHD